MFKTIGEWPTHPGPWKLLFVSALALVIAALYFQHVEELHPCIMCIYQRTAVIGIMLSALMGIFVSQIAPLRIVAQAGWLISAGWGAWIAYDHVQLQSDPFGAFVGCEFVPRFPSWAPLHEWLPDVFAATGSCGDIDWSFAGMTMPQWMLIILSAFLLTGVIVSLCRWIALRKI